MQVAIRLITQQCIQGIPGVSTVTQRSTVELENAPSMIPAPSANKWTVWGGRGPINGVHKFGSISNAIGPSADWSMRSLGEPSSATMAPLTCDL